MIKRLKVSDKTVRKFKSSKTWSYSTITSLTNLVLEQTKGNGEQVPISIGIDKSLSTEQNTNTTSVKINRGKEMNSTFYPKGHEKNDPLVELQNPDGSYYRSIYSSVHHLFYNNYGIYENEENIKNPLLVFGSETGNYQTDRSEMNLLGERGDRYERRLIKKDVLVIEFSKNQFGEKIKPNKFRIRDYSSPHGVIEIIDDGATNLLVSDLSFNEIKEIKHSKSDKIQDPNNQQKFNSSHLNFGYHTSSDGEYILSGSPKDQDSPTDLLTGGAALFKFDSATREFRKIRDFKCPFTQEGLLIESEQDSSGFLVTELNSIMAASDYAINDEFGSSVELKNGTCVVGSPRSHITSDCNESRQGHIFIYEVDKGGIEHWGLVNIIEGDPGSEFGSSVSIHGKYMAVGAPGMYNCEGAIYLFEKKTRTEESPWFRVTNSYKSYCYNEEHGKYAGTPVCDKLSELNENVHRWKISTASPAETPLTYFSEEEDDCEINEIGMFSEETICSVGYETNFPVSKYHTFQTGNKTPKYGIGDFTWELVTIIREKGTYKLGQKVKLYENTLISSNPKERNREAYVFKKRNNGTCDKWYHTQTLQKDKIYNYDTNRLTLSDGFQNIDFKIIGNSVELNVINKPIPEKTSNGFVYSLDKRFGSGEDDDLFDNVVSHGGTISTDQNLVINDIEPGDHLLFIGRYDNLKLVGTPSVLRLSINPHLISIPSREKMVKYPFKYEPVLYEGYGASIATNGKYLLIGDDKDRIYCDESDDITNIKKYTSGSVYIYEIKENTISFIEKVYENDSDENRYSDRFGCDISMVGNDFLVGSPCIEQSKILIEDNGNNIKIPDYEYGVENNYEESYTVPQTMYTSFSYEFIGDDFGDIKISVDITSLDNVAVDYLSDFDIKGSFITKDINLIDTEHGTYTNGIYRDKTELKNGMIVFHANVNADLFDPNERIEFIYYCKKNSIQGTATYFRINDNSVTENIKVIKSTKQKNNVKTQYGISVSLSSEYIYVGNCVLGDWPMDQVSSFDGEEFISFDKCSHIFTESGDVIWGNLEKQELLLEGIILAYDVKTIRDAERIYVGNIFYKNGIAVITELGEYFDGLLGGGGDRGFEITFDGVNSIYENEILCKVNPHEFNVSTNPSSVDYTKIPFDINNDNKFDVIDLSYIYRYIMGTFKRTDVTSTQDSEVTNSLVLEQDKKWPNEDIILSESEDVILMNAIENITVDMEMTRDEELRLLEKLEELHTLGSDGLDIDGDGVVSATDAKLLARYFAGRTGSALIGGLISPFNNNLLRSKAFEVIEYLDRMTGKNFGRKIMKDFLQYEDLNKEDRTGSFLAPYATTIGLYDGPELVMTAKLGRPVKLIPNYPINFLIKYDT